MLLLLAPVESLAPPRTRGRLAQLLPQVSRKPPQLELHGHRRLWGWLLPVFRVTDEELVRSAGLDALIAVRIISFGVILFLPMTVVGMAVLLPINYTSDYYKQYAEEEGMDEYTSVFMRMTISNIRQRSPLLWVHFVVVYLNVFWACWLIVEYYKAGGWGGGVLGAHMPLPACNALYVCWGGC
jgi:hypothetical protein